MGIEPPRNMGSEWFSDGIFMALRSSRGEPTILCFFHENSNMTGYICNNLTFWLWLKMRDTSQNVQKHFFQNDESTVDVDCFLTFSETPVAVQLER